MKTCDDFEGSCCNTCNEDAQEGYFDLLEVYTPDDALFAIVCCRHYDTAQEAADAV